MIARDLMNSDFPFVTVDADLDYVAKLLAESRLGAVPVVDDNLTPIGIVTRSNLEPTRPSSASAELGDVPEFLLRNRARPVFRANGRALRDVMTTPAIAVPSGAALTDIARIMQDHGLKRLPVVESDKIIGLVLRREVMGAMRGDALSARARPVVSIPPPVHEQRALATAAEFRALAAAHAAREEMERLEQRRAAREMREQRIRELAEQRLTEAQWLAMLQRARDAARAGGGEYMLLRFPAELCTDGGRAINAPDPNWMETLRGEARDVYQRWRNELQSQGFKIAAQIVDFPDGLPGDAALFLMWGATPGGGA